MLIGWEVRIWEDDVIWILKLRVYFVYNLLIC